MELPRHEKVALLVRLVGGVGPAARIAKVSRSTIVNWRKPDANQPIEGLIALAIAAHVSLDWVAGLESQRGVDRHLEAALSQSAPASLREAS